MEENKTELKQCSQCKRYKTDYEVKMTTGLKSSGTQYKTCNECRDKLKKLVEITPMKFKKLKLDFAPDEKIKCTKCRIEKPVNEYRVLKYGGVTKTCLSCLKRHQMYQASYE